MWTSSSSHWKPQNSYGITENIITLQKISHSVFSYSSYNYKNVVVCFSKMIPKIHTHQWNTIIIGQVETLSFPNFEKVIKKLQFENFPEKTSNKKYCEVSINVMGKNWFQY